MCAALPVGPCALIPRAPLRPPAVAVPRSSLAHRAAPEPVGWERGDVPPETQPDPEPKDGLKHLKSHLSVSPESCACRGVLSSCTHRALPLEMVRVRVLMRDASSWGCGGQPRSARLAATPVPCVTPRQPGVCHRSAVPPKVGGKSSEHREFGVLTAPGIGAPKSRGGPPKPLGAVAVGGRRMALLQLSNMETCCRPLAESLGKRKRSEGWQRVNGKEVTPLSSVCLITGHLSTSPPGLIPSHARPGVIPLLPVVNYFQSKCETIKQTEGQSLLVRSKERALQRYLAPALSPPSLLLPHSSLWALKQCPDPGWGAGALSGARCRLGFGCCWELEPPLKP